MQILLDNSFIIAELDKEASLLVARWKPETENLSEEEYRAIMLAMVEFIKVNQIKKMAGPNPGF
ncbi:MAG: hypothetical protein HC913_01020 [Microscillaceae bacterium]|nr:hypothetical protein [Microscillaceae bacterium]